MSEAGFIEIVIKDVDAPRLRAIIAGDVPLVFAAGVDVAVFRAGDDWAAFEVGAYARIDHTGYGFVADIAGLDADELRAINPDHLYVAKLGRRITSLDQIIKEKS